MKVSDFTWRKPVTIDVGDTIAAAAELFADAGVGSLVVVDKERPVGIVTDRDLVVRALARGVGPDGRVDGVMSMGVVALDADDDVEELYAVFGRHAIRRVPVVDHDRVVGVISLDDALVSTAGQLAALAGVLSTQIAFPHVRDEAAPPAVISR
jgi:CBS domain-containing protein